MTLRRIPDILLPTHGYHNYAYTPYLLDAAGEKVAFVFRCPDNMILNTVGWRMGVVTTGATLRVSLQNVDAATGNPDGVVDQSNTQIIAAADDYKSFSLAIGNRSMTRGDLFAVVFDWSGGAGNMEILAVSDNAGRGGFQNSAYVSHETVGVWAKQVGSLPCCDLVLSNGTRTHVWGNVPLLGTEAAAAMTIDTLFNSGSLPNQRALRFKLAVPVQVRGAWVRVDPGAGSPFDLILYDADDNVVGSVSVDGDATPENGAIPGAYDFVENSIQLIKDTVYRLALKPTSVLDLTGYHVRTFGANGAGFKGYQGGMHGVGEANEFYLSTRGAGWVDDLNTRPLMGIIVSHLEDGGFSETSRLHVVYLPTGG